MNILIVDKNNTIPALKYGGTERVMWDLGKELTKLGHQVSYLVSGKSQCDFAKIIAYNPNKSINDNIPKNTDIVHFQGNQETVNFPNLVTIHGNFSAGGKGAINAVFVSKNHAQRHNAKAYVQNGLDWDNYTTPNFNATKSYLHFLAKASVKTKNLNSAVKIAVKSKNTLQVMGGYKWTFRNLKKATFYKLHPKINYKGMVDNTEKMTIMKHSMGLLFPVRWHEPFGLAIIESLYAGCPVFASTYGALPEIITKEVGVISNQSQDLINAIKHNTYNAKTCHNYVVDVFNSKKMALNYLKLYEKVLNNETLNDNIPYLPENTPNQLLPFN